MRRHRLYKFTGFEPKYQQARRSTLVQRHRLCPPVSVIYDKYGRTSIYGVAFIYMNYTQFQDSVNNRPCLPPDRITGLFYLLIVLRAFVTFRSYYGPLSPSDRITGLFHLLIVLRAFFTFQSYNMPFPSHDAGTMERKTGPRI